MISVEWTLWHSLIWRVALRRKPKSLHFSAVVFSLPSWIVSNRSLIFASFLALFVCGHVIRVLDHHGRKDLPPSKETKDVDVRG